MLFILAALCAKHPHTSHDAVFSDTNQCLQLKLDVCASQRKVHGKCMPMTHAVTEIQAGK